MDFVLHTESAIRQSNLAPAIRRILALQGSSGAIPWFENGPWDPWNHVEAAMALCVAGARDAADAAFAFLADTQRPDGAWLGDYGNALPVVDRLYLSRESAPTMLDTNFCAYPAVGVTQFMLETGDREWARQYWPMLTGAMEFVLSLQRPDGSVSWSFEAVGTKDDDALLAGNASIAKSLECMIFLAQELGQPVDPWAKGYAALSAALRDTPDVFDRRNTGERFAMDWYYPVLSGVLDHITASRRIEDKWSTFVTPSLGCRCVSDEPWITVAETCELVLALISIGKLDMAQKMFSAISELGDDAGIFWMGWQDEEEIFWPREQPSWTQAAVVLAAHALADSSPSSRVLTTPLL